MADTTETLTQKHLDAVNKGLFALTGSNGQVLTRGASGFSWADAGGGGAWNLIGTAAASNSASLTVTGITSTYGQYAIGISDMIPSGDNKYLAMQVGDSNGIDSGGSDYEHMSKVAVPTNNVGNGDGEGCGGMVYFNRPANGTTHPHFAGTVSCKNLNGNCAGGVFAGIRKAAVAVDRILVKFDSGNIASGRMTIWGIAHT